MKENFITIVEYGEKAFKDECLRLWMKGWKPLFAPEVTFTMDKESFADYGSTYFQVIFTQQWTRTTGSFVEPNH